MNKFDFAANVIKASPLARLTDRAFLAPLVFVCIVWLAALNNKTSFDRAIDFTQWVLSAFIVAEKSKDAITAYGAMTGGTPQSVAVGTMNSESGMASPGPTTEVTKPPSQNVSMLASREPVETFDIGELK